MEMSFSQAVKARRTYYSISKETVVADERILEIINEAIKYAPSAFNSQSARIVILLGEQHDLLWNIVKSELKKIIPVDVFKATEEKINRSFLSGYGSILYFEDMRVIEKLQQQFPTYSDSFPIFSNQSAGMLQFVVWTALEQEGFGASLQHYNPVIDDAVKSKWNIPTSWKLLAQMPFGKPVAEPGEKDFQPLDERVKIYK